MFKFLRQSISNEQSLYLLLLLVATDLVFIILGIIHICGFNKFADICVAFNLDGYFAITKDRGYAEVFQYLKEYWLIILFTLLGINQKTKVYLGWVFLSGYLLLDDSLSFHEKAGAVIAEKLSFIYFLNLKPQDYGELIVFIFVGIIFTFWLSRSYKLADSKNKKILRNLVFLLLSLTSFAIFIDLIHELLINFIFWKASLGIIEDGGEHIVMSIIVSFVWSVVIDNEQKKKNLP